MPTTGIDTYSYGIEQVSSGRHNNYATETSPEDKTSLDMEAFYKLLAAQLQYQNPDDPMDTSQMVSSMAQNMLVTATTQMTQAINQMSSINLTTYSSSMIGKTVRVALVNKDGIYTGETFKGEVTGVDLYSGTPKVYINGEPYELSQIMSVGDTPEPEKPKDEDDTTTDGDKTEGDGSTDTTVPDKDKVEA